MRARGLILVWVLVLAVCSGDKAYANCDGPTVSWLIEDARYYYSKYYICVGESYKYDADATYDGDCDECDGPDDCDNCTGSDICDDGVGLWHGIQKYMWNFNGVGFTDSWTSHGVRWYTFGTAGQKTVRLTARDNDEAPDTPCCCGDGDPDCESDDDEASLGHTVVVVEVSEVVENVSPYDNNGPLYKCVGGSEVLRARPFPSGSWPTDEPTWSIVSQPAGASATLTPSGEYPYIATLSDMSKAGTYKVKAKCGSIDPGDEIDINVIEVNSVTVESGATQTNVIGAKNWAAVKKAEEYVMVKATLNPAISASDVPSCFTWTGGQTVAGEPLKRKVSKATSAETTVRATAGTSSDYVDVWIIWANTVVTAGSNDTIDSGNDAVLLVDGNWPDVLGGGKKLGPIDHNGTPGFTYKYAGGKIQAKATLTPEGVEDVIQDSAWGWRRDIEGQGRYWDNAGNYLLPNEGTWNSGFLMATGFESTADGSIPSNNVDLTPDSGSSTREIYNLDCPAVPLTVLGLPGAPGMTVFYTTDGYINFSQYAIIDLGAAEPEKCSNSVDWSYKAWVDVDKSPGNRVDKNEVKVSHTTTQDSSHYNRRTPTITSITPDNGPTAGGTTVTITGTNFTQTVSAGPTVKIGGNAATNVVLVSTTTITCNTPAGTLGAKDVEVIMPDYFSPATAGSSATLTDGFTYN